MRFNELLRSAARSDVSHPALRRNIEVLAMNRTDLFLGLSALVTGFDEVQLQATGMLVEYLGVMKDTLPEGVLDELLARCERFLRDGPNGQLAATEQPTLSGPGRMLV
jgi:hypothetical protein